MQNRTLRHRLSLLFVWLLAGASLAVGAQDTAPASIRLYVLDCGRMEIADMASFSDAGEYDGRSGKLVDPCFLIRHPKGDLLWDTGLPEAADGMERDGTKVSYPVS